MKPQTQSVREVLSRLAQNGQLGADWQEDAKTALTRMDETQPWYIRSMIGFGAWLASLLFISFVLGVSLVTTKGGFVVIGGLGIAGAVFMRYSLDNDFTNQAALAMNLAGQVLLAIGITQYQSSTDLETLLIILIIINAVLIPIYRDRIFRFLATVFITGAFVVLLYIWKSQATLAFLSPLLALGLLWMVMSEDRFTVKGHDELTRPLTTGLMISIFGITLLSTIYVLPELIRDFEFYPRPWVSTIGFGLLLLMIEYRLLPEIFSSHRSPAALTLYGMTLLIILATLTAPGMVLSLIVITLGVARGNHVMAGLGIAFLALFTGAYFYGIESSLLIKSYSLIGTGLIVLMGRWMLLRLVHAEGENPHA